MPSWSLRAMLPSFFVMVFAHKLFGVSVCGLQLHRTFVLLFRTDLFSRRAVTHSVAMSKQRSFPIQVPARKNIGNVSNSVSEDLRKTR
ncbi:hypothetical protein PHSY_006587 [Pseudozyma hubeiensis SY62]|uniref:Secreted protein n=1 Tax=Pseudozyma hubeiensis (strain SY62) TaxID=1305764 RepID=R9PLL2_PSEHS|nr:hypothetical protein PHSY_006587 [Pseudozyma hubeiensis SY62]GAC98990.1 hypothetical protein PHSY_006587 [Pseudozyma hubeiensis SY62]